MTLNIGDTAPNFTLQATGEKTINLSDYSGQRVILYFYPKDSTSGCTKQACTFNEHLAEFAKENTVILGLSKDSIKSHENFKAKQELKFDLLSDPECKTCMDYGVWVEKSMYGRKYMGVERSTFLIDEKGIIKQIWRKVKVAGHVEEVLEHARTSC